MKNHQKRCIFVMKNGGFLKHEILEKNELKTCQPVKESVTQLLPPLFVPPVILSVVPSSLTNARLSLNTFSNISSMLI